jgi:hypothetical protein
LLLINSGLLSPCFLLLPLPCSYSPFALYFRSSLSSLPPPSLYSTSYGLDWDMFQFSQLWTAFLCL